MYRTISIYWRNDSSDLRDLPEVRTVICGADGMQVLGTTEAIAELHQAVLVNPDKLKLGEAPRPATRRDFENALDFHRGAHPQFESVAEIEEYLQEAAR
jgi:hypothetical protein